MCLPVLRFRDVQGLITWVLEPRLPGFKSCSTVQKPWDLKHVTLWALWAPVAAFHKMEVTKDVQELL